MTMANPHEIPPPLVLSLTLSEANPAEELTCFFCQGPKCQWQTQYKLGGRTIGVGVHESCRNELTRRLTIELLGGRCCPSGPQGPLGATGAAVKPDPESDARVVGTRLRVADMRRALLRAFQVGKRSTWLAPPVAAFFASGLEAGLSTEYPEVFGLIDTDGFGVLLTPETALSEAELQGAWCRPRSNLHHAARHAYMAMRLYTVAWAQAPVGAAKPSHGWTPAVLGPMGSAEGQR